MNKVYDGTTAATVTLSDNRLAGDRFTDSDTSAAFANPDIGVGKTITVSGISITGPDAANYAFNGDATASANITPAATTTAITAAPTITAGAETMVTVTVTSSAGTPTGIVSLTVGGSAAISQALANGSATFALDNLAASTYSLSASYPAQGDFAASAPAAGSLQVNPLITLSPSPLLPLADTVNVPYTQTITAGGGTGFVTLASSVQNAIPGLYVQPSGIGTLIVTGTPTATGTEAFTIIATDQGGGTIRNTYSINIQPGVTVTPDTGLSGGVNQPYERSITASGGIGPYTFALTAGSLPTGLNPLTSSGTISGVPIAAGTYTFRITATDSVGATASRTYSVTINPASWTAGHKGYSQSIAGGSTAATFTLAAKSRLPAGLKLHAATGAIVGTPTRAGTYAFTVIATTTAGGTTIAAREPYMITINPALAIATRKLASSSVNAPGYNQTIVMKSSGTGADTFAVTSKKGLPPGLSLDPNLGSITGTPTVAGTYTFTITATDFVGATASRVYKIVIKPSTTNLTRR